MTHTHHRWHSFVGRTLWRKPKFIIQLLFKYYLKFKVLTHFTLIRHLFNFHTGQPTRALVDGTKWLSHFCVQKKLLALFFCSRLKQPKTDNNFFCNLKKREKKNEILFCFIILTLTCVTLVCLELNNFLHV